MFLLNVTRQTAEASHGRPADTSEPVSTLFSLHLAPVAYRYRYIADLMYFGLVWIISFIDVYRHQRLLDMCSVSPSIVRLGVVEGS